MRVVKSKKSTKSLHPSDYGHDGGGCCCKALIVAVVVIVEVIVGMVVMVVVVVVKNWLVAGLGICSFSLVALLIKKSDKSARARAKELVG